MSSTDLLDREATPRETELRSRWTYEEAFCRNRGLISAAEQETLRRSRVAIAGMGGVGGVHLMTLAPTGIGRFTIADPDVFEVANFNRQCGATVSNLGRNKAEAMAEAARDVNPELELRIYPEAVADGNVDEFLEGADMFVDGLDFFSIDARRLLFRRAAEKGIWAITAGPLGFSTAWLVFDPNGMTFDEYFDLHSRMDRLDQLIAFAVGLAPPATHAGYMDFSRVDVTTGAAPSAALACQLASGALAAETLKVLTRRPNVRPAPHYSQFDAFLQKHRSGLMPSGNRALRQRLKRWFLRRRLVHADLRAHGHQMFPKLATPS